MTGRVQGRIAWSLVVVAAAAGAAAVVLAPDAAKLKQATTVIGMPVYAGVGALIVSRRAGHLVGWLLVVTGVCLAVSETANVYAFRGLVTGPGSLPAATWVAWVEPLIGQPGFIAGVLLLPLLFPDGKLPSPRWRPVLVLIVVEAALELLVRAFAPHPLLLTSPIDGSTEVPVAANPVGIPALGALTTIWELLVNVTFFPILIAVIASLVVRYRRARVIERYQLRWFLYVVAVLPFGFATSALAYGNVVVDTIGELFLLAMPVAIGVAVLRYRLYEIDRLISRTVTYALVTAVLVGVYLLVAIVPSAVFALESDLLVAAATLAAAGVFVPVRRRVQAVVDRRFNRARYDAQQVVERFGSRLRRDLDLDGLAGDLRGVVASTVQPAHVSLWLPGDRS